MELVEIRGLFEMDCGAPSPIVISNENEIVIAFYADEENPSKELQERNSIYDKGVFVLKFKSFIKHSFGLPSNETISGHPYYKLGMRSFSFYELKSSDLIKQLQNIEKVHPYYTSEKWKEYRHYILTFHDNMFECVAKEFEVREENISIYHQATTMLNELFVKQF
jgi:hypothetical protein